jgi:hypothetical protein
MALLMPNEVIHAMHRLAAACKKYKGIVFTDSEGKIINDNSPENDNGNSNSPDKDSDNGAEITEITGVGNTTYPVSTGNTSTSTNNTTITGVDNNKNNTTTTGLDTNNETQKWAI